MQAEAAAKWQSLYNGVSEQAERSRVDAEQKAEFADMLQHQAAVLQVRQSSGQFALHTANSRPAAFVAQGRRAAGARPGNRENCVDSSQLWPSCM